MREHVLYNKAGEFINLYLAFDIYYKNKENHKDFPFIQMEGLKYMDENLPKDKFRLNLLNKFIKDFKPSCVVLDYDSPFLKKFKQRTFINLDEDTNIFEQV